jgi:flap endonuclease-1
MGIKQLSKLIEEFAPDAIVIERVKDWRGRYVAIDVSNYLYQFVYKADKKRPASHIAGFFQLIHELASAGVTPVMIFDGTPCDAKDYIFEKRAEERLRKEERLAELVDRRQIERLEDQIIEIAPEMWTDIRELFRLSGVPVLQAPHEADLLASRLAGAGQVYGVVSEDLDHLTFGATRLIRDFNNKREPDCRVYYLDRVLSGLQLTPEQFIDVCILCGCDYTPKIEGIAWKKAYQLIKSLGSIERVVEAIVAGEKGFTGFKVPEEFNYVGARAIFNMKPETDLSGISNAPDCAGLKTMLMSRCHYRDATAEQKIREILNLRFRIDPCGPKTLVKKPVVTLRKETIASETVPIDACQPEHKVSLVCQPAQPMIDKHQHVE